MTFIGEVSDHLLPMEEKALPAMIEALSRIQPGDDTDFLLNGLLKLDIETQKATPALIRLLYRPDLCSPYRVLHNLGHTRDPRMAPFPAALPHSRNGDIREAAHGALASITFDKMTPAERASESQYIAIIYSLGPPTYSSNQTIKTSGGAPVSKP